LGVEVVLQEEDIEKGKAIKIKRNIAKTTAGGGRRIILKQIDINITQEGRTMYEPGANVLIAVHFFSINC
jgi:hypothetical protein